MAKISITPHQSGGFTVRRDEGDSNPGREVTVPAPDPVVVRRGHTLAVIRNPGPLPTVLFEAGSPGGLLNWAFVLDLLADRADVIAYSRAGYREAAERQELWPRTLADAVHDLALLVRALSIETPIIVGHSAGGLIARRYCAEFPRSVRALVLVDATPVGALPILQNQPQEGPYAGEFDWPAELSQASSLDQEDILGSLPTVVMTATEPNDWPEWAQERKHFFETHGARLCELMLRLSTNTRNVPVASPHDIPGQRPDAIVDVIESLLSGA